MNFFSFLKQLHDVSGQLANSGNSALAKRASSLAGALEKLGIPDVEISEIGGVLNSGKARKKAKKKSSNTEQTLKMASGILKLFKVARDEAHEGDLSATKMEEVAAALKKRTTTLRVLAKVFEELNYSTPKKKHEAVEFLLETLRNSQRRATRV